jgi:hypothetical protein
MWIAGIGDMVGPEPTESLNLAMLVFFDIKEGRP